MEEESKKYMFTKSRIQQILEEVIGNDDDETARVIEQLEKLFISEENEVVPEMDRNSRETSGGVYMIQIKSIKGRPISFTDNCGRGDRMVLIKFGRADNYKNRFSQFGFEYEEIFKINGDNCMEATLKQLFPPNFKNNFFKGAKVATLKQYFSMPASCNPGFTEWRIMSREFVDDIKHLAMTPNFFCNYKNLLKASHSETFISYEPDDLTFNIDLKDSPKFYTINNKHNIQVYDTLSTNAQ